VSGGFRDIGQVPSRNFDWLSFTPPSSHLLQSFIVLVADVKAHDLSHL
jgi:hypothetical protein